MATHHFRANLFHNTFGSHEPVLRVAPGDTIITELLDSGGIDAAGVQRASSPNPQTGPFFVTGAEVGDTLVVHFDAMMPNRAQGWAFDHLAPNVVDPEAVPTYSWGGRERVRATWIVDGDRVRLAETVAGIGRLELPLAPMIGAFGVAPPLAQAISTMTSGSYGGNMDYRGFRAGTTVYLPIFTPGALFMIGDGHALQGDGEISGTGIEISFTVQFTLDIRRGGNIGWPRGEDAEWIFTVGNARPMDQALQHATTEMLRWLGDDYQLDSRAAGLLLSSCVRYDVGNVYDPAYTIVCKLPKAVLPAR